MGTPFLAEIRMTSYNFAPKGWAMCNGQLLAINQNTALFSLLGTTYGGNGITTFALPDFRSRVSVGWGQGSGLSNYSLGQTGGEETVALTQFPAHSHGMLAYNSNAAFSNPTNNPTGALLIPAKVASSGAQVNSFASSGSLVPMAPEVGFAGSGQAHSNIPPVLCLNFIIALQGIFPSRN